MSADNGIYILPTLGEWRAAPCQAIENIYWHPIRCECNKYNEDDVCTVCGVKLNYEEKEEPYGEIIKEYFGDSPVFTTAKDAYNYAMQLYREILDDYIGLCEYGIVELNCWQDKEFPK